MSRLRCFVGLPLPADAVAALCRCGQLIRELDASWAGQKWVSRDNLHVTIAFLGDVEGALIPEISSSISECVAGLEGLALSFTALEAVPRASRTSMLWARAADDGSCARLAADLGRSLGTHEILRDQRPFVPHVTLARARRPLHAPQCLSGAYAASLLRAIIVSDPAVTLFSSQLTEAGPVYEGLATFTLKGVG